MYEPVVLPKTPFVHPGLLVKQTHLTKGKQRLPFYGLFARCDLPRNTFLGYYTGEFYDDEEDDIPVSLYAVNGSGFTVIPPGEEDPDGVDPRYYPLAMMNEPPRGTSANVDVVEWLFAKDAVPGIPPKQKVNVLAVHTCRDILAGEELYFYYGELYDRRHYGKRPYNVGCACERPVRRNDVPHSERPCQALLRRGISSALEGHVYVRI